jgi:hypothetical protein
MPQAQDSVVLSPPARLRVLLDETVAEGRLWSGADLRSLFEHQWSAPLAVDLGGMRRVSVERVRALAASAGRLRSFGDLMAHPRPPLELLELTKEFAKQCLADPGAGLPEDIARVLYFASIAVAFMRHGRRITMLDEARIAAGLSWAQSHEWLTQGARDVLTAGLEAFDRQDSGPDRDRACPGEMGGARGQGLGAHD